MVATWEREYGGIEPYVRTAGLRSDQVASLRDALIGADRPGPRLPVRMQ